MKKIVTIVGARPQIIKASAISRAIKSFYKDKIDELIVHTGQHYDHNMSEIFFKELGIPNPAYNIHVESGSHGEQTAKMIEGIEGILIKEKPHGVILYGDTNSTISGALAAVKLHIPVIHIEAGLRSFKKEMPEEINRICCDHMSSMLFVPTKQGIKNLCNEGFSIDNNGTAELNKPHIYHSGDIMYDNSLYFSQDTQNKSNIIDNLKLDINEFILCTIHRDSNTDNKDKFLGILRALQNVQETSGLHIVLPLHPRTKKKIDDLNKEPIVKKILSNDQMAIIPPVGFFDIIELEKNSRLIITDSGGIQKEAFFFEKPCVILREQTEWVEIVDNGNAIICGGDDQKIIAAVHSLMVKTDFTYPSLFGDGNAGKFICSKILSEL